MKEVTGKYIVTSKLDKHILIGFYNRANFYFVAHVKPFRGFHLAVAIFCCLGYIPHGHQRNNLLTQFLSCTHWPLYFSFSGRDIEACGLKRKGQK